MLAALALACDIPHWDFPLDHVETFAGCQEVTRAEKQALPYSFKRVQVMLFRSIVKLL